MPEPHPDKAVVEIAGGSNPLGPRKILIPPFTVGIYEGSTEKPVLFPPCTVEADYFHILVRKGTCIAESDVRRPVILTQGTLGLYFGSEKARAVGGRGDYLIYVIGWPKEPLEALTESYEILRTSRDDLTAVHLTDLPPEIKAHFDQISDPEHVAENLTAATLVALAALAIEPFQTADTHCILAEIPAEATGSLRELLENVKANPEQRWSLKEAADLAGYSAFHLSRTFRAMAEYGFPEFVDRCRAEMAIELLLNSEDSIEDVVLKTGIGSQQRLRAATRDYLGFLPSEIRRQTQATAGR